jgi:hypothetical protein
MMVGTPLGGQRTEGGERMSVGAGQLEGGISPPRDGAEWHVLGHTYWNRAWCESAFAFETLDPPGTFVPPHIHPTQDEFIHVLEGELEVELDGQRHKATAGSATSTPRTRTSAACSGSRRPAGSRSSSTSFTR